MQSSGRGGDRGKSKQSRRDQLSQGARLEISISAPGHQMVDRWKRGQRLKELTVQEGLQSQFGSRVGIFSQHLALLHQGRDINKISKEVTDGDAAENRLIS